MQGQDPRGARLAVRARTEGLSAADVDRALGEERSLLITWLNRGTLHLVRSEDYPWLQALTTPPLQAGNARRLGQEGVTPNEAERGVRTIERALAAEGPLTRPQLRERLESADVPTAGQALVHLLMLACLRGIAVRGPTVGKQHAYALVRDWLGPLKEVDHETALTELARRYLAGHGPAGERDLARWAGLPLRDVRKGLTGARLGARGARRGPALARPPPARGRAAAAAPARALRPRPARLDLARGHSRQAHRAGHRQRPLPALRDGRGAGGRDLEAGEGKVAIEPLGPISTGDRAALEADAADVERFMEAY